MSIKAFRLGRLSGGGAGAFVALLSVGGAAGFIVSPWLFATTAALAILVWRNPTPAGRAYGRKSTATTALPPAVAHSLERALRQLPRGEARRLLGSVVEQARALYGKPHATFDDARERQTRVNVDALVVACCATALELDRLDRVQKDRARRIDRPAGTARPSGGVDARLVAAREQFVQRLYDSASALTALYAADLVEGAAAGQRVGELADEITADAASRRAAVDEVASALGEG